MTEAFSLINCPVHGEVHFPIADLAKTRAEHEGCWAAREREQKAKAQAAGLRLLAALLQEVAGGVSGYDTIAALAGLWARLDQEPQRNEIYIRQEDP